LQRQLDKAPQGAKHPENFPTYEGWLGTFAALPTFPSHGFRVLGDDKAAEPGKSHKPTSSATREGIRATLGVLRTRQGSTAAPVVANVFTAASAAFETTVPEPGWSDVGASDVNAGERIVGHARRIPLAGLPGPAQAIIVLPAQITGGPQLVDVLLHFYSRNVGYKADRDISVDEIEAQLEGSNRRMLAVLPQGTADADFGQFDASNYLAAVFTTLDSILRTPQLAAVHGELDLIVAAGRCDPDRVRGAAVIDALPGLGKTTAANSFARGFDRDQIRRHGPLNGEGHEAGQVPRPTPPDRPAPRTCSTSERPGIARTVRAGGPGSGHTRALARCTPSPGREITPVS
jgi:hypothetical protein